MGERFRVDYLGDMRWGVIDTADGRLVGIDGGEPEDQLLCRDWKWVVVELNLLAATLAARDERVRELGEELVEREAVCDMWRSSVSEGIEERDRLRSRVRELEAEVSAWRSWNAPVLDAKPAPAEEPREVVEPKSAVGLAVEELRRREGCPNCAAMAAVLRAYWPVNRRPQELARLLAIYAPTVKESLSVAPDHTEDPLAMVEPAPAPAQSRPADATAESVVGWLAADAVGTAPAPARWRCEGCGENPVKGTPWIIPFSPDPMLVHGENGYYCGPVVSVGEAGS